MRLYAAACAAICVLALAARAQPVRAASEIESFFLTPSTTQAGGHPDISTSIAFGAEPVETPKSLLFDWPAGLAVLAPAVAQCELADLESGQCSSDTQLGVATIREAGEDSEVLLGTVPVFQLESVPGSFERIGFLIPVIEEPVLGEYTMRTGSDYGTRLSLGEFPSSSRLASLDLKLWGVPAGQENDDERFPSGSPGCPGSADTSCITTPTSSNLPAHPQIENPTWCGGPYLAKVLLSTQAEHLYSAETDYPQTTGCNQLSFDPAVDLALTTTEVRSPTALDLDLTIPQIQGISTPSPTELRDAYLHFEDGVLLGSGPETMTACDPAEAGIGTEEAPSCPAAAKLGTATVDGPWLPAAISGSVYYMGEDAHGDYLALLAASGYGVNVKLPFVLGEEGVESSTAAIVFENLPQLPIQELTLHLFSATELLETVNECGDFKTVTEFVPWDTQLASQRAWNQFSLDAGPEGRPCPGPATHVDLSLSPSRIPVAGNSTSTATARVTDANGGPAAFDVVKFRSSDPGERIGAVREIEDGVYLATISSPTVAGNVTITAVDTSVEPNVSGLATLEQVGLTGGPAPGPAIPVTTITRHPRRRSHNRRPVFAFRSNLPRSTFRCSIDAEPFRGCSAPLRLPELRPGRHRFRVFAVSPDGHAGEPASFRFKVLKP